VRDRVLDSSVVVKWFRAEGERHISAARSLRAEFESGALMIFAPRLLQLEILNAAGRRWRWSEAELLTLAETLDQLNFEIIEPEASRVALWIARGLTAYDAAYLAVSEQGGLRLVTDDEGILAVAGSLAEPLAAYV
jgi:predicted nucleic acid-binding protein